MEMSGNISREEGLRLLKAGQIDEALAVFQQLVVANPIDPQIQTYLGVAYNSKNDKLHAIAAFERAANLQETPQAYYNLGQVYEQSHRVDEAIRQYRMAIEIDAGYAPAQQALDRLHVKHEINSPQPEPTIAMPAAPGVSAAPGTAPPPVVGPAYNPAQPASQSGPPDWYAIQAEKQRKIQEQRREMIRSGLTYGVLCGAGFSLFLYLVFALLMAPAAVMMGLKPGGIVIFVLIGSMRGGIMGGLIGLWIGYTCGGDTAGLTAGAVIGAVSGLISGLIAGGNGIIIVMSMFSSIICAGIFGYIVGKMVDASIGQI